MIIVLKIPKEIKTRENRNAKVLYEHQLNHKICENEIFFF